MHFAGYCELMYCCSVCVCVCVCADWGPVSYVITFSLAQQVVPACDCLWPHGQWLMHCHAWIIQILIHSLTHSLEHSLASAWIHVQSPAARAKIENQTVAWTASTRMRSGIRIAIEIAIGFPPSLVWKGFSCCISGRTSMGLKQIRKLQPVTAICVHIITTYTNKLQVFVHHNQVQVHSWVAKYAQICFDGAMQVF